MKALQIEAEEEQEGITGRSRTEAAKRDVVNVHPRPTFFELCRSQKLNLSTT